MKEPSPPTPYRIAHFSPLRYPGGKGKLAAFVKKLIEQNRLHDGHYCEPYAGGAAIALELLFHGYVDQIHINDISRGVYCFWNSVINDTDALIRRIEKTKVTVQAWARQKVVFANEASADELDLAFAVFFLNRTNRSGILNGGMIGGKAQTGLWKIDARYNTRELVQRISSIAALGDQIHVTQLDALEFLAGVTTTLPGDRTLVYLDPPYYGKGKELYYDFYSHADHLLVAQYVRARLKAHNWIVSYDNVPEIHAMYAGARKIEYSVGYSARDARTGSEVMFFSKNLTPPDSTGAMQIRNSLADAVDGL